MSKPYLDTYFNEDNNVVLVYVSEANPFESSEAQHLIIKEHHLEAIIKELKEMQSDIGE